MTPREEARQHKMSTGHSLVHEGEEHWFCLTCGEEFVPSEGPCRFVTLVAGREFICVLPEHDDPRGTPPRADRHYLRRRYPHGDH